MLSVAVTVTFVIRSVVIPNFMFAITDLGKFLNAHCTAEKFCHTHTRAFTHCTFHDASLKKFWG